MNIQRLILICFFKLVFFGINASMHSNQSVFKAAAFKVPVWEDGQPYIVVVEAFDETNMTELKTSIEWPFFRQI